MRILKKSLSLLLAIAMIASLVVVNVSAADPDVEYVMEITPSTVKTGQEVTLNVYLRDASGADSVVVNGAAYVINYDPEVFEATNKTIAGNPFATNRNATAKTISGIKSVANGDDSDNATILKDSPIQTVTLKALKTVEADEEITFSFVAGATASKFADGLSSYVVKQDDTAKVTIKPSFVATVATLDGDVAAVKAGTAKSDIINTLATKTATVKESDADDAKSDSAYATSGWDCDTYDAEVPGTYTFTGLVTPDDSKAGGWTGDLAVTKDVVVSALEDADTTVTITTDEKKLKVKQGDVVDDVAALVKAAVTKIEFTGNGLTREVSTDATGITFTADANIVGTEEVGTEIEAMIALADVDAGEGLFVDIDHEEVVKVVIVPAEIAGASITIDNATASGKIKVTATLPASELDATVAPHIYGAGYEAVWSEAEAAIVAMKSAMGRADGDTATPNVDNKTMYVGLDKLTPSAVYSIEVLNPDGDAVDLSNTSTSYTAAKDEVVFYWTFSQDNNITLDPPAPNPERAGEDVVDGGTYTIVVYEGEGEAKAEIDRIEVVAGEAEVLGDTPTTYSGTFTLAIDAGTAVLDTHTYEKTFTIGEDAEVTVDENGIATVILTADEKLSEILDSDEAGTEFTVSVAYNGAALVVDTTEGGEAVIGEGGKIMVTFNTDVPGIGNSQGNVKVETPAKDDEPGTDEPGTDEPGTDEPGTDEPAAEGPFADVAADHWAASYIATLKDAGIVGGVNDTDFAPDNNITRAEYAKMIAGVFGLEATVAESVFEDCAADAWYTPYVAACTEAGYIKGVSETEFAPEALITREQACAILGRALNAVSEGELTFTDAAEVEEYAKANIAALVEMGLVNGYEDGTFAPKNNITRAEAAKIMAGAYAKVAPVEEAPAE